MKTFLKIILTAGLLFAMFSFGVRASAEEEREYIITADGQEYVLSCSIGASVTPVRRSESIAQICDYISTFSAERTRIVFAGITVNESVEFNHTALTVSGSLTLSEGALFTVNSGYAELLELTLTLGDKDSYLRIKDGTVLFENSNINSDFGTAVILDYSAGAEFNIISGKIYSESDYTVKNEYGTVNVSGGEIHNSKGSAIWTGSTLNLSGKPKITGKTYGITTVSPVRLSVGNERFSGAVSIQYLEEFKEGSLSCVLYRADSESIKNTVLYDENGELQKLEFFEEFVGIKEKNFGAVYLPYTVDFYIGKTLVYSVETLGEKSVSSYSAPLKEGYEFVGWCTDENGEKLYDFAKNVNNSLKLYAKYRLSRPSFEILSFEFIYDGMPHDFGIVSLTHPLLDKGIINYTWYRDGSVVSNSGPEIKLISVSESGIYKCKIDFTYGTDTVSVTTSEVSVTVNKARVEIPKIDAKYYTGEYQTPDIYTTSVFTVSKTGGALVGKYPVKLTLNDTENYEFAGGGTVAFSEFEIIKAENFFTEEFEVFDVYTGCAPSVSATSRFGEVKYKYSTEYDCGYSENFPTGPGTYYCMATVEGTDNYESLESLPKKFSVIEEKITGISVNSMPEKTFYRAFEYFNKQGLSVSISYNSSRTEIIGADKLSVQYQSAGNIRYGDSAVIVSYLGFSVPVHITVEKAEYDVSNIIFNDTELVFNGEKQSVNYSGVLPVGLDGIPLECKILGEGKNAGIYTVLLIFTSSSKNYKIPDTLEAHLTILPYESDVIFGNTDFVYDGKIKCPDAYYTDVYGRKIALEVSGAYSLAGEYTALALNNDNNYKLIGPSVTYRIAKAEYDFSKTFWSGDTFGYDGFEKAVSVSGLPDGVSVIGYSDSKAIGAGEYLAKVILSYDENNYNPPPEISHLWRIEKADYDISTFSFSDTTHIFNGKEQFPNLTGNMPTGLDGIILEYYFDAGATHVSEGRKEVKIIFTTKSGNYNIPESICAYVEILPLGVAVRWNYFEFTYDTSSHAPNAESDVCDVSVIGAKTNAGNYTATAVSLNPDYYIVNSTAEFIIKKAENFWSSSLKVNDIFEGDTPSPRAQSFGGDVFYIYYSDEDCTNEIDVPTSCGKYYVIAYTDGNSNYGSLTSNPERFEIKEVLPIAMIVKMNRTEFSAFEKIGNGDFTVTLKNNNGSFVTVSSDAVQISYQTADSLRFNDGYIKVCCLGFSEDVSLKVKKADYDMSGVSWTENVFTYDGAEKSITLIGLPEGVKVVSYSGNKGIYAGEYTASAEFTYDAYNYNKPVIPNGVLTVRKKTVIAPSIEALIYNGKEQTPEILLTEIYSASFSQEITVGEYPVRLNLYDSANYEFAGGLSETVIYYKILPMEITVELSDIDKYLLSDMPKPSYKIVSGEAVNGENLELIFSYGEGEVTCTSKNPNYSVSVIPGKINRHNTLSKDTVFLFFLIFLIIVTLILLTVILIVRRGDIAHYISVLKCRFSPIAKSVSNSDCSETKTATFIPEKVEEVVLNPDVEAALSVNREHADSLITDNLAKSLVKKEDIKIITDGTKKRIINVDTLSKSFASGESIDVNVLKENRLVPYDTAYVKVLARGMIDKPLKVYANDFSLSAVKMIALTGGEAIRVVTVKKKKKNTDGESDKISENT